MEQSSYLFAGDSYDTPPDAPKSVWYRLLLKNRWYFYVNNFGIFCRTGRCGRRGELTKERQISYSNENLRLVERCGGKVHLRGLDNLRALDGRPVVLIGNHMSLLETALFHSVARGLVDFTFVIKQSLMEVPFFRDIMTSLEAIPIGRANPRDDLKAVFEEGGKLLASGRSIIIFRNPPAARSSTRRSSIRSESSWRSGPECRCCPLPSKPTSSGTAGISAISARCGRSGRSGSNSARRARWPGTARSCSRRLSLLFGNA